MPASRPTSPAPEKEHLISREFIAFILDRRARQLSPNTIKYYQTELNWFQDYLKARRIRLVDQIDADLIRRYLIDLAERRNPISVHASFRAIKAFFTWFTAELDDPTWRNPMRKVEPPKINKDPLPGITPEHVQALIDACGRGMLGERDKAIIYMLYDTGVRKSELVHLDFGDVDLRTGAIRIRSGKGNKDRTVFMGNRARRELIRYLRYRGELVPASPLWTTQTGERLTASGLRQLVRRRAEAAGIPCPGLHDFRRAYAIQSLRNNIDLATLAKSMGHSTLEMTRRYLDLVDDDLRRAHEKTSPADNL